MAILSFFVYSPIHGAYTEMFAGLSPDVTLAKNGAWSESTFYTL
jgi:retinol dehydrogenase 12